MKFFKVTLNTVGKDNEKVFFIIPPADERDENGNPVYDEDFLLTNVEYKSYVKETKAAVVEVSYILYEADDTTKLNYDELLKSESSFFKLEQNEYLIEVKKAKPKSGGKKSPTAIYFILGIVGAAVIAMLVYGSSIKKKGDETVKSGNGTTEVTVDTYITNSEEEIPTSTEVEASTSEDDFSHLTAAEVTVGTEVSTPASTDEAPITTAAETKYVLTFDMNGGTGLPNNAEYAGGTVIELPFTGISKIGHTLMGWATAPTEPYTLYNNETSRYIMPSASATLYAVWTAAEYEVTYNYQIGANAVTSKDRCKYGEIIRLRDISNTDSDAGEFLGWGLTPNSDEPVQSLTMPDGGIELYAIYEKGGEHTDESTSAALL